MKKIDPASPRRRPVDFDIDDLLHPARAFAHPRHVVDDPDLTLNEKRAILGIVGVRRLCDRGGSEASAGARHRPAGPLRRRDGRAAVARPASRRSLPRSAALSARAGESRPRHVRAQGEP